MTERLEMQVTNVDRFPVRALMTKDRFDPLAKEIYALKKPLNAVILTHNYQVGEIQDVADYVSDSPACSIARPEPAPASSSSRSIAKTATA